MPLTVTPVGDGSPAGAGEPAAPPTRRARQAAAAAKVSKSAAPAEPGTTAAPATGKPTTPAAPAQALKPGEVAKPEVPAVVAEPRDMKTAIELERAQRELEKHKGESALHAERLRALTTAEEARKKDWRRALADSGHDIDDVMLQYVGGDAPGTAAKPGTSATPAAASSPELAALQAAHAELLAKFDALDGALRAGGQQFSRNQRLDSLRGIATGDDFEATMAMEAHEAALANIERIELERGNQLGDVELRETLGVFEAKTRETIAAQIKKLGGTKWAKALMRDLLQEQIETTAADVPATEEAPMRVNLMNGDGAGAMRTRELSYDERKRIAREKATANIAARGQR